MNLQWKHILLIGLLVGGIQNAQGNESQNSGQVGMSQKRDKAIEAREKRQQERIEKGIESGNLTAKEATKLEKQQAKIEESEKKAEADGKITKKESRKINQKLNRASKSIRALKHNSEKSKH